MKRYAFLNILEHWNLECYVMGSLLIQIILVFIAPMRRWSNNGLMHVVIWLVYLMAIFFSTFALSLIYYHDAAKEKKEYAVYPLWAPFLLVHLGGPHTITALSVEDNNLWHRHVLTIVVQGCSVLVVLYQYRILDSEWLLPTAIVFLVGIVKCFERIFSLQFASPDFVRWSMLERARNVGKKTTRMVSGLDEELEIVRRGYELYQTFKGFIIDHTFIINKDTTEMEWFRKLEDDEEVKVAFKVMEMELYFMYEGMFTKMVAVEYWKDNYFWCIWRFVCHALLITVTVIFFCHSKHQLHPSVIGITYCLLGCALLLDQLALLNLIFSHWTIVKIMNSSCYKATASEEKGKATASEVVSNIILPVIHCGLKLFVNKRWSGKIIQYSLVRHSRGRLKWAELKPEFYYLREAIDSCLYTETAEVEDRLKELVFKYIQRVANSHQQQQQKEEDLYHGNMDDYATCVLILHVATEICYHLTAADDEEEEKKAKFCIQISQYLAYLLVLEGNITSTLPGSIGMRFKDICEEQVNYTFGHLHSTFNPPDKGRWCRKRMSIKQACQNLINEEWEKRRNKTDVEQQRECEDSCLTKENKYSSCNDEQLEDNNQKEKITITEDVEQPRACEDPCLTKENKYSSCNDEQLKDNHESDNHEKPVLLKAAVDLAAAMIIQIDPKAGNDKQQQQKDLEAGNNEEQQQRSKVFWEGLSEVWVGLLVYASTHCRGDVYYLNRGGQFYTFVRLLMAHFGLQQSLKFERSFQFHNEICTNLSKPSFQLYHDICTNLRLKPTTSGK
ncbi:uncharacterized protein LOC116025533 [Ipomoea triloba]|uniref:uncharacterized protein LOC116025533 n=1 Tax=Ipomoea triloba TaxID=35885 RepID=UPI00125D53CA|nr:uncharacterized protein LOC116025533 [Ipomoea triloba]